MSDPRFLIRDYATTRDAVTDTFTTGVQTLARLMDEWRDSGQDTNGKKSISFRSHANHYQWLLKINFSAEGFSNPEHGGQIGSIAYLEGLREMFADLAKAQATRVARNKEPMTDAQRTCTGNMIRTYHTCEEDYKDFIRKTGYETSLEKIGEEEKRKTLAATHRSDRALQIARDDLAFLIGAKIIAPLPKP
ncbi:MAG: hypothetical protein WBK91_10020 [Alphaproteobacteria bacterium]